MPILHQTDRTYPEAFGYRGYEETELQSQLDPSCRKGRYPQPG